MSPLLSAIERNQRALLIFGSSPQALVSGKIPTVKEVILAIEYKISKTDKNSNLVLDIIFSQVVEELIQIYKSFEEKTFNCNFYSLKRKVKTVYHSFFLECKRYSIDKRTGQFRFSSKKSSKQYKDSIKFKTKCIQLFEISITSKPSLSQSETIGGSSVPVASFSDSSNTDVSAMQINSSDIESGIEGANIISSSSVPAATFSDSTSDIDICEMQTDSSDIESGIEDNIADPSFVIKEKKKRVKIREVLSPQLFNDGDRFGKSNEALRREGARESGGHLFSNEGMRKARKSHRLDNARPKFDPPIAIGFDERRDDCKESSNNNFTKKENVSVVLFYENGKEVIAGHFVPINGSGKGLGKGLFDFCNEYEIDLSKLCALVSDGCPKMIGHTSGAHSVFENLIGRPLVRCICFFHHLEKSFSCQFKFHGGETTGPSTLTQPWHNLLKGDIHRRQIKDFKVIKNEILLQMIEKMDPNIKLSKDHSIFKGLCQVILTGKQNKSVHRKIGPINHARFTTVETRIIRAYLSEDNPSEQLLAMVNFLINVWAPVFMQSKLHCINKFMGPKFLLLETKLAKMHLSNPESEVLSKSLSINGLHASHENILLACLASDDVTERQLGVNILMNIRSKPPIKGIRKLSADAYKVNIDATCLSDLNVINLSEAKFEPAVTKCLSDSEIMSILNTPLNIKLPVSSVAVERAVKLTTRCAVLAGSVKEVNGVMQCSILSQKSNY